VKGRTWLVLSVLACGISWMYATKVLLPWDGAVDRRQGDLKAQMGDLYPRWVGTRELLLHGKNPYGPEVSREIQTAYYGHAVAEDNLSSGRRILDEWRFAYPVYVVFLMAPTMRVDFTAVRCWAPVCLALFAALCVPFCLRMLDWRPGPAVAAAITLFTVASPPVVQAIEHQQLSVAAALFLFAGAWCVRRNYQVAAGFLLAWSTIKPQMTLFPLMFFLVWVAGDLRKRWRLLAAFLGSLGLLAGAGELVLPGWIGYFLEGAVAYQKYFPTTSVLRVLMGDLLGEISGGLICVGLLVLAWSNRREPANSTGFVNRFAAFLMGTSVALPLLTPFNQVLLILPALLLIRHWEVLPRISRGVFTACIGWPWITSLVLLIVSPPLDPTNRMPLLPSLPTLYFPLLLPLLLFSQRYRAVPTNRPADFMFS
jgi:hypothetical protein